MMENREQITNEIIKFVRNEFLDDDDEDMEITAATPLITSGIIDSFSMVSLKTYLEKKFDIKIPDARATETAFDSIDNILNLVEEFTK